MGEQRISVSQLRETWYVVYLTRCTQGLMETAEVDSREYSVLCLTSLSSRQRASLLGTDLDQITDTSKGAAKQ